MPALPAVLEAAEAALQLRRDFSFLLSDAVSSSARRPKVRRIGCAEPSLLRADWEEHVEHVLEVAASQGPAAVGAACNDAIPDNTVDLRPPDVGTACVLLACYSARFAQAREAAHAVRIVAAAAYQQPDAAAEVTVEEWGAVRIV